MSAEKSGFPFRSTVNLLMILRGMTLPALSLRWPDSITCETRVFTSMTSPFWAVFLSRRMRGLTSDMALFLAVEGSARTSTAAAADRHLDELRIHEHRAVVHLGEGDDVLGFGEADASVRLRDAAQGREAERHDAAARVGVGDDHQIGHVRLLGHRALDRDVHRHRIAVLGDLRQVELNFAFHRLLAA